MSIKTVNPATNEVVASFDEMTAPQIEVAISTAHKIFQGWRQTSYEERAELLYKVAKLIRQKKSTLAKTITLELSLIHI